MRRSAVLAAATMLVACACSSSHSAPKPKPQAPVAKNIVSAEDEAVAAVSARIDTDSSGMKSSCHFATYHCQIDAVSAGAAAAYLGSRLRLDGSTVHPGRVVPPTVTSLVSATEITASAVRREAADLTVRSSEHQVKDLVDEVVALRALVDEWRPTGTAGRIVTKDQIVINPAHPVHLKTRLNVRPEAQLRVTSLGSANFVKTGKKCKGVNGFDDLKLGAEVTIYDASGRKVVGVGPVVVAAVDGNECDFIADIRNLPPASFYQVQFETRPKLAFSEKQLLTQTEVTQFGAS